MRSTEMLTAATALAPRWRTGEAESGIPEVPEQDDGSADADWSELDPSIVDPYGQQFRPHLFGI